MDRPNVNYRGSEWAAVEDWLKAELLETYKRLAGLNMSDNETQQIRGRASFINMMLNFKDLPNAAD